MTIERGELAVGELGYGRSHLIEANAGTGKTYAIANLFLRFVLEGRRAQEILVVTFTRAATDELRGRVRRRLAEARKALRAGETDANEDAFFRGLPERYPPGEARDAAISRLELALLDIQEAPIHTIHGFCQQVLAEQAFASGQSFDLEQADDGELTLAAMRDWWRGQTYGLCGEELAFFFRLFASFESFRERLQPLLKAPPPELVPEPLPPAGLDAARRRIHDRLGELARLWREHGGMARELLLTHKALSRTRDSGQKAEDLEPVLDELDRLFSGSSPTLPGQEALARIARGRLAFTARGKNREDFDREPFLTAGKLYGEMEDYFRLLGVGRLDDARRFVRERVRRAKEREGLLSYDDMIERLHRALEGDGGGILARRLAERYPVVLVDEFQDTDALQYAIFSHVHDADREHTLVLIGDPKQAIYGFRGGDIFTYLQAGKEASERWTLSTNWRATPAMIEAVNAVFNRLDPFTYTEIPYTPSRPPAPARDRVPLFIGDTEIPALRVERFPLQDNGKPLSKGKLLEHVHRAVAHRIGELLAAGARLGGKPLEPRHIAILVRTGNEAAAVRRVLMETGIGAVSAGRTSIWTSVEGEGLRTVLKACLAPTDRDRLREALGVEFLALPPGEIHAIVNDPPRWTRWAGLIRESGETWQRHGVMPALHGLVHGLADALSPAGEAAGSGGWPARLEDPERTLTNLLHLAEILQSASREHGDGERLLRWMRAQEEVENPDEYELRLESDAELVRIVTVHKSKGLEYPVVFLPYLWYRFKFKNRDSLTWHEREAGGYRHRFKPWAGKEDGEWKLAEHERLAEDVRLAYVALTRSAAHCHLFFGPAQGDAGRSALAWLLHDRDRRIDLDRESFAVEDAGIDLSALEGEPDIEILEPCDMSTPNPYRPPPSDVASPAAADLERPIRNNWRIASYSSMTRNVHQATHVAPAARQGDFALNYPAGARVGSFLHALLERLDTRAAIEPQVEELGRKLALRYGVATAQDLPALAAWLGQVLETPLAADGPTLGGLSPGRSRRELAFDLRTGEVDWRQLDELLRAHSGLPVQPLEFETFQGMVTGVIDLVFEHGCRYYLADYKSNLLGRTLEDYTAERLGKEIRARRYDLQYLLYTLALHRHLRQRLRGYDYDRDFGGVYYLFLRAMRPEHGARYGIFFTRPERELVEELDGGVFATAAGATA